MPLAFLAVILLGAGLLMLPAARTAAGTDLMLPALFTAVSAVCVTGLTTVDTATFWTPFGQGVILALIQVGGFGIMTLATLLSLLVRKTIGLRGQLVAQSETHTLNFGDVRSVLFRVARLMVLFEAATAIILPPPAAGSATTRTRPPRSGTGPPTPSPRSTTPASPSTATTSSALQMTLGSSSPSAQPSSPADSASPCSSPY